MPTRVVSGASETFVSLATFSTTPWRNQTMQHLDLIGSFPIDRYPSMKDAQITALTILRREDGVVVLELPTGSGKTAIGYTYLTALGRLGKHGLFYVVPNKTLAEQVKVLHPDVSVVYGRNEYPCLYYPGQELKADEIPCSILADCPHRVDQETGETHTVGTLPCPYLRQKYEAKQSTGIVVCTSAFYLFVVLFSQEFEPQGVVIDEAHRLAQSIRLVLSTELTDWKLAKGIEALNAVGSGQCHTLGEFLKRMKSLVKRRAMDQETLLEEDDVQRLYDVLSNVNPEALEADTRKALRSGDLDADDDREVLKQLEEIARSVRRFRHALKYALTGATERGYPLSFVIAYGKTEMGERERVQYRVVVRDYYVVPIIRRLLPKRTLAYSATISDPDVFAFETGSKGAYHSIPSTFPAKNARIYLPTDTADLSVKGRQKRDKTRMLRLIARSAKRFANKGHRSLIIVVSNDERENFLMLAAEEGLNAISYGKGHTPRQCATRFRCGEGDCLVGTVANYGEGIDLPKQIAPIIFSFRPGYPNPTDPQAGFEERRFGRRRWSLWNWRVMLDLLQVRGRNIRSETDIGVTFLISQQFRRFAFASLPEWLRPAYRGDLTFAQCEGDALKLLG